MNVRVFLIAIVLMLGAGVALTAQNKKPANDKETVVFDVSMTCENCQKRIENNLAFEKGVTKLKVDLDKKTVEVEYKKSQTTVEKLQAAIQKLGYDVKLHANVQKKE